MKDKPKSNNWRLRLNNYLNPLYPFNWLSKSLANRTFHLVKHETDCPLCRCHKEPWCCECNEHWADCDCIKPNQPDVEYIEVHGKLYGRREYE